MLTAQQLGRLAHLSFNSRMANVSLCIIQKTAWLHDYRTVVLTRVLKSCSSYYHSPLGQCWIKVGAIDAAALGLFREIGPQSGREFFSTFIFLGCAQMASPCWSHGGAPQQAAACTPAATSIFLQQAHWFLTALLTCLFLRHFVMCDVSVQIISATTSLDWSSCLTFASVMSHDNCCKNLQLFLF